MKYMFSIKTIMCLITAGCFGCTVLTAQEALSGDSVIAKEEQHSQHARSAELVKIFGGDVLVAESERYKNVVVIGGNVDVKGLVDEDIVVIGGNLTLSGSVDGEVVVIGGKSILHDGAQIGQNLVLIGSQNSIASPARVHGDRVIIAPWAGVSIKLFTRYVSECVFKGRFFAPSLPWTLFVLGTIIVLMILFSLVFQSTFKRGIAVVDERSLFALFIGMLVPVALGPVVIALFVTIIGIPAVPALILTLHGAIFLGLSSISAHCGKKILRLFNPSIALPDIIFLLIGSTVIAAIMMIPYIGGFVTVIVTTVGTGAAIIAMFEKIKEVHIKCHTTRMSNSNEIKYDKMGNTAAESVALPPQPLQTITPALMPVPATFLQRAGAAMIDIILCMIFFGVIKQLIMLLPFDWVCNRFGLINMMILVIYSIIMWSWRQTTIGMIVFRLKVFRADGSRLTPGVAVIRGLGLILSIVPLGLGFLWVAWDERHQGWHDKIADTVVCKVSENVSIL